MQDDIKKASIAVNNEEDAVKCVKVYVEVEYDVF